MLYLLGGLALIFIIYGLILFFKRGNKEFNPKLSLRERTELEKMVEKKALERAQDEEKSKERILEVKEKDTETITPNAKATYPTKEIQNEVSKYATHVDIENLNVQNSIRIGVENFLNQNFMVALEEFSLATESNSRDAIGFYLRGLTKLKVKNYESALIDFSEAINLKMKEPSALYYRGLAYYYMRDLDNAILNFKGYLILESNSAEAYFDLGICLKEKDKHEEAIKNFSMAIQKRPVYVIAYFERGLLRHKQGDSEGGCGDLRKALGLGYIEAENYLNELCKDSTP